jgi:hypothetical protein
MVLVSTLLKDMQSAPALPRAAWKVLINEAEVNLKRHAVAVEPKCLRVYAAQACRVGSTAAAARMVVNHNWVLSM